MFQKSGFPLTDCGNDGTLKDIFEAISMSWGSQRGMKMQPTPAPLQGGELREVPSWEGIEGWVRLPRTDREIFETMTQKEKVCGIVIPAVFAGRHLSCPAKLKGYLCLAPYMRQAYC